MIRFTAKYLPVLDLFAAKDDLRFYLNGFRIEPAATGCYLIATNGHVLVLIHDEAGHCDEPAIYPIPRSLLAAAKVTNTARIKRKRLVAAESYRQIHLEPMLAKLTDSDGVIMAQRCIPIDGKYPDWRRLIPSTDASSDKPAYIGDEYAELVGKTGRLLRHSSRDHQGVRVSTNGAQMHVRYDGHPVFVIVMQRRDDDSGYPRQWLDAAIEFGKPPEPPAPDFDYETSREASARALEVGAD